MDTRYILSVDQSTSGTKALLVGKSGSIIGRCSIDHPQIYPKPGWVEHDPQLIYQNVLKVIRELLHATGTVPNQIAALSITNQRETAVVWDKDTGNPVYNAIVWQCRRTAGFCEDLKTGGHENEVREKTGLVLDPYFSASKIRWILEYAKQNGEQLGKGRLLAGTMDSWLIWKLTGGAVHATDYTNASRTSLFNIHTLEWDSDLITMFGVDEVSLPEVKSSNEIFGYADIPDLFSDRVPICGVIGDSQAALFGQLCHQPGMAKATYGTGTSVMMNTGTKAAVHPGNGLVTAIAWGIDGKIDYALEGIIHCTGDCLKWVREQLGLFGDYSEAEALAASLGGNEGVYLIPAFVGLGAPYWQPNAKAAILGMSRSSDKRHIIRAALESIAYQVKDTVALMESEAGIEIRGLRVDGGATENRFLMQFQADLLQIEVVKPSVSELSAVGSAFLGGLGIGFWDSVHDLYRLFQSDIVYTHRTDVSIMDGCYLGWKRAVQAVIS